MSALIFTGDLQEILPGELAVRGSQGHSGQPVRCMRNLQSLTLQGFTVSC